jgi:hypothetical protein
MTVKKKKPASRRGRSSRRGAVLAVRWKRHPGSAIQAPLSGWGHYVISHRPQNHTVSYRPRGHHVHVGSFTTETLAKRAAREHAKLSSAKRLAFKPTPWLGVQENLDALERDLAQLRGTPL